VKEGESVEKAKEYQAGPLKMILGSWESGGLVWDGHKLVHWGPPPPPITAVTRGLEKLAIGLGAYQTANRIQGLRDMKAAVEDLVRALNTMKE
jgi:hypothetical protein